MTAYVVVDIDVTDPIGYEEYKRLAAPAVALYGGKYLARGGSTETLEGDWLPTRLVIMEFENSAQAKKWFDSPEYIEERKVKYKTSKSKMVVIEGV